MALQSKFCSECGARSEHTEPVSEGPVDGVLRGDSGAQPSESIEPPARGPLASVRAKLLVAGGASALAAAVAVAFSLASPGSGGSNTECLDAFNRLGLQGNWELAFKLKSLGDASGKASNTADYLKLVSVSVGVVRDHSNQCVLTFVPPTPKSADDALGASGYAMSPQGTQVFYAKDGTGSIRQGGTADVASLPDSVRQFNATFAIDESGDLILKNGTDQDTGSGQLNVDPTGRSSEYGSAREGEAGAVGAMANTSRADADQPAAAGTAGSSLGCPPDGTGFDWGFIGTGVGCEEALDIAIGWQSGGFGGTKGDPVSIRNGWDCHVDYSRPQAYRCERESSFFAWAPHD